MLLTDKVSQLATDSDIVHAWVNGPASGISSEVSTEAGLVRTPARLIADMEAAIVTASENIVLFASSNGAGLVGYLPAGVGAVAADVKTKLRETPSIRDFYANGVSGAFCYPTGIIDSSVGAQKFFDALPTASEVVIVGDYKITQRVTLNKPVRIKGNGLGYVQGRFIDDLGVNLADMSYVLVHGVIFDGIQLCGKR